MKRRLRDHIELGCPLAEAETRVAEYFAAHRRPDGETHVRLRVPLGGLGLPAGLALEREVTARCRRGRDADNLNDVILIDWNAGDDPFPTFEGTLVTWAEGDPSRSFVELDGSYEPPFGAAGEIFEEAIGHEIAGRTARSLLDDIAAFVAAARTRSQA